MSKHTPGPWELKKQDGDEWWFGGSGGAEIVISQAGTKHSAIAVIGAELGKDGIDDANARLIAAAPELLDALIAVRDKHHSDDVWEAVNAAISKATGGQQ